jgi:hypothetical protein
LFNIILTLSSLCFASCTKSVAPANPHFLTRHIGETCVVQFRRDALGAGASLPIGPTVDSQYGANVSQHGKLIAVEGKGNVLESPIDKNTTTLTLWIPYHSILTVMFQRDKWAPYGRRYMKQRIFSLIAILALVCCKKLLPVERDSVLSAAVNGRNKPKA